MTNPDTVSASGQLARSAGVTGAATLASRVLGLVRDQVLAALFGAGNEMDAFVVAFRIPNLVRALFAEGVMSSAFVPTFTRHLTRYGREDAFRLGNNIVNGLLLTTGLLVAAGIVVARPLVTLYAGDFGRVPGKLDLTIALTRAMLPFIVMAAIAAAAMGMLNSLHRFFLPALAPAAFNVATIICAFALVPLMPAFGVPRITAIAIGALVGGVGQIAMQWPLLRREGFGYRLAFNPADEGLREVLLLMGPGTIGLAATQINNFINTLLATTQGTGAVSWLTYAFRLMYLPLGLFGVSIGTAVLPVVSRHAAADDVPGMRHTLSRGLAMMLIVSVPATLGLIVLAQPIVQLLFEHGHFRPADTIATAAAVRLYAIGLVGYSAARIASPTFYAIGRSRVPVAVSAATIAFNVVLSITLVRALGFVGLALSTSVAAMANGGALVWLLRRQLGGIEGRTLGVVLIKVSLAALAMAFAAVAIENRIAALAGTGGFAARTLAVAAAIGGGIVVLAVASKLLGLSELDEVLAATGARVRKLLSP